MRFADGGGEVQEKGGGGEVGRYLRRGFAIDVLTAKCEPNMRRQEGRQMYYQSYKIELHRYF